MAETDVQLPDPVLLYVSSPGLGRAADSGPKPRPLAWHVGVGKDLNGTCSVDAVCRQGVRKCRRTPTNNGIGQAGADVCIHAHTDMHGRGHARTLRPE